MAAHADEAGMVRVGDYLIERFRAHGFAHVFGVPGDFVLGAVCRLKRPGYIELPRDIVETEVPRVPLLPAPREASDPQTLAAALAEATEWIARARQPVIILGVELYRFDLVEPAMRFVDRTGIPTTVSLLDKSAIDERHPSFIGLYAGALGRREVQEYVEGRDCLIRLGTLPTDINLGIYTARLDPARSIDATHDR